MFHVFVPFKCYIPMYKQWVFGKHCCRYFCNSVWWRYWKWHGWPSRVVSVARRHVLWFISLLSCCLCSGFENHSHFHSYSHSFLVYSCPCEDKWDVLRCKCVCVCLRMRWLILWLHYFSQLIGLFTSLEWNDFMEVPDWLLQSCDLLCQMPIPL